MRESGSTTLFPQDYVVKKEASKAAWGALFKPPPPAPLCAGHSEAAVKRRVTKKGANLGREFYACARGEGRSDDPAARCDFFKWAK
jgi:AP endonuclease-2